jgi:hypothetical protein
MIVEQGTGIDRRLPDRPARCAKGNPLVRE